MLEELALLESAAGKDSFHALALGGDSVFVSWKVWGEIPLELRCRRDGDGDLRLIFIEEGRGAKLIELDPEGSTWELTLGTGGQAFRALLPPARVCLSGQAPSANRPDPFARQ